MYRFAASAAAGALCSLFLLSSPSNGQKDKKDKDKPKHPHLKFSAFHEHVKKAKYSDYKKKKGIKVASRAEFKKMQAHLLDRHKHHKVKHTFLSKHGHPIDCVPIDQQPAMRLKALKGHKIHLKGPTLPKVKQQVTKKAPGKRKRVVISLPKGKKDAHGNKRAAPKGTIPIRRVTLEDLARFKTLKAYYRKHPNGGRIPLAKPQVDELNHRYAVGEQSVDNFGGISLLNLWQPVPTTGEFSLSQVWYRAGDPFQTVEAGWQVYPEKYGHNRPVLFIYWTPDGYSDDGPSAYNLEGPGFVQINSSIVLGSSLNPVSTTGGDQLGIEVVWYKKGVHGPWWLGMEQPGGDFIWVGYYPRELYGSGPMANKATTITYGGEVGSTGDNSGQMGSGEFAKAGEGKAAFQSNIGYYPTPSRWRPATLKAIQTNEACYTIQIHNKSGTNWGTYFYFGGPKCP